MATQKVNQALNVRQSQDYDDNIDLSQALSGDNLEFDLNVLRTLVKLVTGEANFQTAPTTSLKALAQSAPETKTITYKDSEFQDITIPAAQNFVALSNAGDPPSGNVAIASSAIGIIASLLPGPAGTLHSLNTDADESNLIDIRDADTNLQMKDASGNPIKGLLQVSNTSVDGDPFALTGANAAQISLVVRDPLTEALIPAPILDVENKTIEYSFRNRALFVDLPEGFADSLSNFARFSSTTSAVVANEVEDVLTVSFPGETAFNLSSLPSAGTVIEMMVNGIVYHRNIHFTVAGQLLTWTYGLFSLDTIDTVVVTYRV